MAETFRRRLLNAVLRIIEGLAVSCVAAVIVRFGVGIWIEPSLREWVRSNEILQALIIVWIYAIFLSALWPILPRLIEINLRFCIRRSDFRAATEESQVALKRRDAPRWPHLFTSLLLLSGVLLIVCAVPALFIYLALDPTNYAKGIQVSVFLMSTGIGTVYYWKHQERIQGPVAVVGYFAAVCTGPAGVVMILL